MPESISSEKFYEDIPAFVGIVHDLATRIAREAIVHPELNMQIRGLTIDEMGEYSSITAANELTVPLQGPYPRREVRIDIPLEDRRMAIEDVSTSHDRDVRIWTYIPAIAPYIFRKGKPASIEAADETELPTPKSVDWLASMARKDLGNLALPGYIFGNDFREVDDPFHARPHISAYVFTPADIVRGQSMYHGSTDVGNLLADYFETAIAPPFSDDDRTLMQQAREAYHVANIAAIIKNMRLVAGELQ
jgi:hypothetical protein